MVNKVNINEIVAMRILINNFSVTICVTWSEVWIELARDRGNVWSLSFKFDSRILYLDTTINSVITQKFATDGIFSFRPRTL
jgi:hypothetical protein